MGFLGSGKSTLASHLLTDGSRRLISTDQIRSRLFGDAAVQGSWLKVWLEVWQQFLQIVQQIYQNQLQSGIYDATNAVRKQRRQAIALARSCGFTHITGIWLNPPLDLCLERNRQRDRQVPEAIILRMSRRLYAAPPAPDEGLDELIEINHTLQNPNQTRVKF